MSFPVKFGTYEVFRIILPGFYCLVLIFASALVFNPTRQFFLDASSHPAFLFISAAIGVFLGLALYAYDHPKRIAAYTKLEMPSAYLKKRLCDVCQSHCKNTIKDEGEAIDSYFYVFYEIFGSGVQARVLYIGSVYHVFADVRMLSFVFGVTIFPLSFLGVLIRTLPLSDVGFAFLASSVLVLFWLLLHPEYLRKSARSKGDKYEGYIMKMQRRFIDIEIDRIKRKFCDTQIASGKHQ